MNAPNPYATPQAHGLISEAQRDWPAHVPGLWRAGDLLVATRQVEFPPFCPVTNEPAATKVTAYFPWSPKDLYPLRFGLIVGVLYWLSRVKHTLLLVPITARDQRSRTGRLLVGCTSGVLALILIGLLFYLTTQQTAQRKPGQTFLEREGKVLMVTGAALGCLIVSLFVLHGMPDPTKSLLVREVRGDIIFLAGAHPSYLERLTRYDGPMPTAS